MLKEPSSIVSTVSGVLPVKNRERKTKNADVAELADALVSGSSEAIHVGSSPVIRTKQE